MKRLVLLVVVGVLCLSGSASAAHPWHRVVLRATPAGRTWISSRRWRDGGTVIARIYVHGHALKRVAISKCAFGFQGRGIVGTLSGCEKGRSRLELVVATTRAHPQRVVLKYR